MKFIALFAAAASALSIQQRASPLSVKLEMVGNSEVKATITNTGSENVRLLRTGTILDSAAVEKTNVFSGGEPYLSLPSSLYIFSLICLAAAKVPFDGLRLRVQTSALDETAFTPLAAGSSISTTFDIAQVHDLSVGGSFSVSSSGFIPYAKGDSVDLAPEPLSYTTNSLTASVHGPTAAKVRRDFHDIAKRQVVQSDCTGTKLTQTNTALSQCRQLAAAASSAAASGAAAKMTEYFKSSSSSTRSTVAAVFGRVATECGGGRVSKQYCSDVYSSCSSGVLAYTLPSQSYMVNCPLYFSALSALSKTCHAQDKATTTLHETTHLSQIAGTTDQGGCYGYSCVQSLSASQNLKHADTYALFANGKSKLPW